MKKKISAMLISCITLLSLAACGSEPANTPAADQDKPTQEENQFEVQGGAYAAILETYYRALQEKWDGQRLSDEGLSLLIPYCYEGDARKNVGYKLMDLNGDGTDELVTGAISGDTFAKGKIFDLYTLADGVPVHVISAGERDRYYIVKDSNTSYSFANEASASALSSAWFYEILDGSELKLTQAILFDAESDTGSTWFTANDKNWDLTTAEPIDANTALNIIGTKESQYLTLTYLPFGDLVK